MDSDIKPILEKRFECNVCGKKFTLKRVMRTHEKSHSGVKPFKCELCKKAFTSAAYRRIHLRTHTGEQPYNCDICGKSFISLPLLQSHKAVHSSDKPFKCEICDKTYTISKRLRRHIKIIHSSDKPYKCDICDMSFISLSLLRPHKLVHSSDRPFKCEVCEKAFKVSGELKRHKQIHSNEKPYKCGVCDKAFKLSSALNTHKRIHSSEIPFRCRICGNGFHFAGNLRRHERTHSSERPFKCGKCDMSFKDVSNLRSHERTHSTDAHDQKQIWKCRICKKTFAKRMYLFQHNALKHILNGDSIQTQGFNGYERKRDNSIISAASTKREECFDSNASVSTPFLDKILESKQDLVNQNDIKTEIDTGEGFVIFLKQEEQNNKEDVEDNKQTIKNGISNQYSGEIVIKAEEDSIFEFNNITNIQGNEINDEIEVRETYISIKEESETVEDINQTANYEILNQD